MTAPCSGRFPPGRGRHRSRSATASGSQMPRAGRSRASAAPGSARRCRSQGRRGSPATTAACCGPPLPRRNRSPPAPRARRCRIPLENGDFSIGDAGPATNAGPVFQQLTYATCPYLLNYPDAAGAAGRVLRPEVAAAPPRVSPDGRTWTFRIRPGFRFSPPSGQAVTAETFKATIERALSPKLTVLGGRPNQDAQLIPTIVGATAFAAGRAAHITGITASGDTLTIRVTRPTGELPARLRTSYFCPVPIGTPAVPGGGKPTPIPMAGPYRVAWSGMVRWCWSGTRTTAATGLGGSRESSTPTGSRHPKRSRA